MLWCTEPEKYQKTEDVTHFVFEARPLPLPFFSSPFMTSASDFVPRRRVLRLKVGASSSTESLGSVAATETFLARVSTLR